MNWLKFHRPGRQIHAYTDCGVFAKTIQCWAEVRDVNHSIGCAAVAFGGLTSDIPIQPWVGLLPKRRTRVSGRNSSYSVDGQTVAQYFLSDLLTPGFEIDW